MTKNCLPDVSLSQEYILHLFAMVFVLNVVYLLLTILFYNYGHIIFSWESACIKNR